LAAIVIHPIGVIGLTNKALPFNILFASLSDIYSFVKQWGQKQISWKVRYLP